VPALGEAISEARRLVDPPLSDELNETCDEVALGLTWEQALNRLEARVPSRNLKVALLTLRVGQKTGGQLESVLSSTLEALRELARLETVLRSKTAEGKLQLRVIGFIPIPLVAAVRAIDPDFFRPLETTFTGHLLILMALGFWGASFLLASRILRVEF
jgi:tight adherence protein B